MTRTTKISLAVIGALVLALVGGYLGAGMRGADANASTQAGSWMDDIKDRGEFRVGVAIAPPMTVEKDGKLGGANLIPLQHLADELGVKLVPVSATWNNIVAGLQAGRYDVAANLDSTLERAKAIQFSDPVYEYQGRRTRLWFSCRWSRRSDLIVERSSVASAPHSPLPLFVVV